TFSGVGTDISRWERDRDYGRDGQTPPSGTAAAVVVCATPHEGKRGCGAVSQRLPSVQQLERFLASSPGKLRQELFHVFCIYFNKCFQVIMFYFSLRLRETYFLDEPIFSVPQR
ncbi:hypothetical protein AVEN_156568-1, partial [Araneus ventricosus]